MKAMNTGTQRVAALHRWWGCLALVNVLVGTIDATMGSGAALAEAAKPLRIVAFGDSLTSGYGLRSEPVIPRATAEGAEEARP